MMKTSMMWMMALLLIGLALSGCVGHKAIRICLPDADSEIEFEGPSSISGVSTGKIDLKGRGSYLSIPMYMDAGKQQLILEYLHGLADCPLMDAQPIPGANVQ